MILSNKDWDKIVQWLENYCAILESEFADIDTVNEVEKFIEERKEGNRELRKAEIELELAESYMKYKMKKGKE